VLSEFDEPVSDAACKSGELEVGTVVVIAIIETDEEFAFPSSTITYAL
jgi:hypothetical protein